MDLKHILSKLENAAEEDTERLLQQYNREVSPGSAFSRRPGQTPALALALALAASERAKRRVPTITLEFTQYPVFCFFFSGVTELKTCEITTLWYKISMKFVVILLPKIASQCKHLSLNFTLLMRHQWKLNGDINHLLVHVLPELLLFCVCVCVSTISVLSVSEQSHLYF